MLEEILIAHLKVKDKNIQMKISGMSFTESLDELDDNTSYPNKWILRLDETNGYYCKERTNKIPPNEPWLKCKIEKLVVLRYDCKPRTIYPERVSLWQKLKGIFNGKTN